MFECSCSWKETDIHMLLSQITSQTQKNWRGGLNEVRGMKTGGSGHKYSTGVTSGQAQCERALEVWEELP